MCRRLVSGEGRAEGGEENLPVGSPSLGSQDCFNVNVAYFLTGK